MKRNLVILGVLVVLAAAVQPVAATSMLFGTIGNGGNPSMLVEIDQENGDVIRLIAQLGYAVNGLAWDHTTDTLFATTRAVGGGPDKNLAYNGLISIDVETGAVTEIGPAAPGWGVSVNNISVNSQGEIYAIRALPFDDIVTIDKTTGALTILGEIAPVGGYGLAFDGTDILWLTNQEGDVYVVDLETGPVLVSNIGWQSHHGVFDFLTGSYIGLDVVEPFKHLPHGAKIAPLEGTVLVVADLENGTIVNTIPTAEDLHTLAFVPQRWKRSHLIGTSGYGGSNSTLVQINPDTGSVVQTIGDIELPVNGLEYDATTGKLYGVTKDTGENFVGLIEIDIHTGEATEIGESGWDYLPQGDGQPAVTNLTSNSIGELFAWYEGTDDLVSIDKDTGVAAVVGDSELFTLMYGLAFDAADRLWLANGTSDLHLINPITGAAVQVGILEDGEQSLVAVHHGDFDFVTGDHYGVYGETDLKAALPRQLVRADLPADLMEEVMPTDPDLHTVTAVPAAGENMLGTVNYGGNASYLVRFDPRFVGAAGMQVLGPIGYVVNGLEYDISTGNLYGTTSVNDFFFNGLLQINPQTGGGSPIGSDWGQAITCLTSNLAGQLFAWGESSEIGPLKAATDDLLSINKSTGVATEIGDSGLETWSYGLAFDEADRLFLYNFDGTYAINPTTGAAVYEGSVGQYAHHGDFDFFSGDYIGLSRPPQGMVLKEANPEDSVRNLVVVNPANHSLIAVVPGFASGLHTLTYLPPFEDGFETGDFSRWSSAVGN